MARVDPGDDSIARFIVRHYRYDPQRRERRHVVVPVFDNEREFRACVESVYAEIGRREDGGGLVDPREYVGSCARAGVSAPGGELAHGDAGDQARGCRAVDR